MNINKDVVNIRNWSSANCLCLNPSKSKSIIFGSPGLVRSLDRDILPRVQVGDVELTYSLSVKNLGVWMEHDLSWNKQIASIAGRIHGTLRQLRASRSCLPHHLRIGLIRALIFPHIDYCSLLLLGCPLHIDVRLKRLLNLCIRFIFGLRGNVSITPRYADLRWLLPNYRRSYFLGKLTYSLLCNKSPHYLSDHFTFKCDISNRPTRRSALDLVVPAAKTDFGKNSFLSEAPLFWNSLPEDIRKAESIHTFSKRLAEFLISKEIIDIRSQYR